jgi:hypothetical protein
VSDKKGHRLTREIVIATIGSTAAAILLEYFVGFGRVLLFIWHLLTAKIGVPVWLLSFLLIIIALAFYIIGRNVLRSLIIPPFLAYREDVFLGIRWRWGYEGNQLTEPQAFCPNCQTRLITDYAEPPRGLGPANYGLHTQFICEHCNWRSNALAGTLSDIRNRIMREIERKVHVGEWQQQIESKG